MCFFLLAMGPVTRTPPLECLRFIWSWRVKSVDFVSIWMRKASVELQELSVHGGEVFSKMLCLVQGMFAVGLEGSFILGYFLCPTVLEHETQTASGGGWTAW